MSKEDNPAILKKKACNSKTEKEFMYRGKYTIIHTYWDPFTFFFYIKYYVKQFYTTNYFLDCALKTPQIRSLIASLIPFLIASLIATLIVLLFP